MSMKNSNDTIGNRTRDLLTCSAVPQATAPPRSHRYSTSKEIHFKPPNFPLYCIHMCVFPTLDIRFTELSHSFISNLLLYSFPFSLTVLHVTISAAKRVKIKWSVCLFQHRWSGGAYPFISNLANKWNWVDFTLQLLLAWVSIHFIHLIWG